jgi:hypothetical protein
LLARPERITLEGSIGKYALVDFLTITKSLKSFVTLPFKMKNEQNPTSRFRNKDYKETWEYQEELFKGIVDLKIRNRRGAYFSNPNYLCLWNILMFIP